MSEKLCSPGKPGTHDHENIIVPKTGAISKAKSEVRKENLYGRFMLMKTIAVCHPTDWQQMRECGNQFI